MLALIVVVCLTAIKTIGTNAKTTFTNVLVAQRQLAAWRAPAVVALRLAARQGSRRNRLSCLVTPAIAQNRWLRRPRLMRKAEPDGKRPSAFLARRQSLSHSDGRQDR